MTAKTIDVVVLTEDRYADPKERNDYINNVLLEDDLVLTALKKKGLQAVRRSWNDPDLNWSEARVLLFRTTWDYFDRFPEFQSWLGRVGQNCTLVNSREVIYWNMDKHYLADLYSNGVNIPPTRFFERGEKADLNEVLDNTHWQEAVIKPCVSGAGRHTYRINKENAGANNALFNTLLNAESMMVQEFQQRIVSEGEMSLILIDGQYSHAVLKKAMPGEFRVQDDFGGSVRPCNATDEEIAFAQKCVALSQKDLLYARVDIFRDNHGELCLAELELIEPELWFRFSPQAADQLADGVVKRLANAL